MKNYFNKILFIVFILVIGTNVNIYSQQVPDMVKPFVKLEKWAIISYYQNPVVQNGSLVSYGTYLKTEKKPWWTGSGTIISPDGLILTNNHVATNSDNSINNVEVVDSVKNIIAVIRPISSMAVYVLNDNDPLKVPIEKYFALPIAFDHKNGHDVALLKITTDAQTNQPVTRKDFNYVDIGNPFKIPISSKLTVLGYPGVGGNTLTVSAGGFLGYTNNAYIDAGKDRIPVANGMLKSDATIQHGNSGGAALFDGNLVGIPTQGSIGGGFAFGYLTPVTWAEGLLTKAEVEYGEDFPIIDNSWFKSDYNADITKSESYSAGKIYSGQTKLPVQNATVLIYRSDKTLNQIIDLNNSVKLVSKIAEIQELYNKGYSISQIAKAYGLAANDVKNMIELKVKDLPVDVQNYLNGDFYYKIVATDANGFFMTILPQNQQLNCVVEKNGFHDLNTTIQTGDDASENMGTLYLYEY